MAERQPDPRFALPAVDQPASEEVGVVLAGLAAERLLAGLGVATHADDPTGVALLVERLAHGAAALTADAMVLAGARRWRAVRTALPVTGRGALPSASVRQAWAQATRVVRTAELDRTGSAGLAYLAACWLRGDEVDDVVAALLGPATNDHCGQRGDDRVVSEVAT